MGDATLEVVGTFLTRMEADLARGALEAEDIQATVFADDASGIRPSLWMSGVRLLVRAEDAERARAILEAADPPDDL